MHKKNETTLIPYGKKIKSWIRFSITIQGLRPIFKIMDLLFYNHSRPTAYFCYLLFSIIIQGLRPIFAICYFLSSIFYLLLSFKAYGLFLKKHNYFRSIFFLLLSFKAYGLFLKSWICFSIIIQGIRPILKKTQLFPFYLFPFTFSLLPFPFYLLSAFTKPATSTPKNAPLGILSFSLSVIHFKPNHCP